MEIDSHAACLITRTASSSSSEDGIHMREFPIISADCSEVTGFIQQIRHGVNNGCSFFVTVEPCALPFLNNFRKIHDLAEQKYEKKVLVILDTEKVLTYQGITNVLGHETVNNDLPLTLLLQQDVDNDWIDIWSTFPYSQMYNRFFLGNISWQYNKHLIPIITDLSGTTVFGAFIHYPPYAAYYHVTPGNGNAQLYKSNENLSVQLEGQEHTLLVEFCLKYKCTITARLDYDEELWLGQLYPNQTDGLIGALQKRDANVSCAALYLWDNVYPFTQFSSIIQRAIITHIVPIPLPLPYWQTPILPFSGVIWGCVVGAFLTLALTMFVVNAAKLESNAHENQNRRGLFDSFYAVFMLSIFQGVYIRIQLFSDAVIFTLILLYALVIGNLYLGGLANVLTITRYEMPVGSIEKLVDSGLSWGGTSWDWIFTIRESENKVLQKFISKFIVEPAPVLLRSVQKHKMAITVETLQYGALSYEPFIDYDTSAHYMLMKTPLYWQYTVIMSSKTWPFMGQLNRIVHMQQESGIGYYWETNAAFKTTDYNINRNIDKNRLPPEDSKAVKLSIYHILGALFLLLFGNTAATISFFLELLLKYRDRLYKSVF